MKKYFVRIYYKDRRIEFFIDSEPINDNKTLHEKILDYMGKNDMQVIKHGNNFPGNKWEYYLTYEEVVDGSRSRPLQEEKVVRT